jgi:hypothetical protein
VPTYVLGTFYIVFFGYQGYERRKNCKPSCMVHLGRSRNDPKVLWVFLYVGIQILVTKLRLFLGTPPPGRQASTAYLAGKKTSSFFSEETSHAENSSVS